MDGYEFDSMHFFVLWRQFWRCGITDIFFLQTFRGNTDTDSVVSKTLAAPVTAKCFRLYPMEWYMYVNLQMEVMGCPTA